MAQQHPISITVPVRVSPSRNSRPRENQPQKSLCMVLLRSNGRERGEVAVQDRSVLFSEEVAWELEGEQSMIQKQKKRAGSCWDKLYRDPALMPCLSQS